jgi:hypothetical protein
MRPTARILIAALFGALSGSAFAADDAAAAWTAARRADAAQQALSDRYTAIWTTLDSGQKARFGAQERAWLNEGREREVQACVSRAGAQTDLVVSRCAADVVERHLSALPAPQRVATSS